MIATNRIAALLVLFLTGTAFSAPVRNEPLGLTKVEPASQKEMLQSEKPIAIGGRVYKGYIRTQCGDISFGTWKTTSGFKGFEAYCGINDEYSGDVSSATFKVFLDGDLVQTVTLSKGDKAALVAIPVTEGQSLRLEISHPKSICEAAGVIAEPKLTRSVPATGSSSGTSPSGTASSSSAKYKCSVCGRGFDSLGDRDMHTKIEHGSATSGTSAASSVVGGSALFAVDAKDLDILASGLRKRVDSNPSIKQKVDTGFVALMTFNLVDISSQSVATNVAEDLSTAMINNQFGLVERGQLDKALKELKIQDSALIDPTTAKKIGQFTGCDIILVGSISDRGDRVVVNGRLLETATGKALAAERVEMRKVPISR